MILTENLNYLLELNGYSVKVFAKRIDVSYPKANSYLKGSQMKFETLLLISEKFNVSCDDLLKTDLSKLPKTDFRGKYGNFVDVDFTTTEQQGLREPDLQYQTSFKENLLALLINDADVQNTISNFCKMELRQELTLQQLQYHIQQIEKQKESTT